MKKKMVHRLLIPQKYAAFFGHNNVLLLEVIHIKELT
jgi:hypothetical protein